MECAVGPKPLVPPLREAYATVVLLYGTQYTSWGVEVLGHGHGREDAKRGLEMIIR